MIHNVPPRPELHAGGDLRLEAVYQRSLGNKLNKWARWLVFKQNCWVRFSWSGYMAKIYIWQPNTLTLHLTWPICGLKQMPVILVEILW